MSIPGGRHGGACLLLCLLAGFLPAAKPPVTAIAFTPDGKSVIAASQSGVHVYSWPGLKRRRTIEVVATNLHCLAFSPTGTRLAVGGGNPSEEGIVEVFSWPDGKPVSVWTEHNDSVRAVVWRGNAHLFSASIDREIKLWDMTRKSSLATLKGHSRSVAAVCLVNEGKLLVSAADDLSLRVWDVASGKLVRSLSQHTRPVRALAVRPGRQARPMVASAAADRTIRFWQPTIGRMVRYVRLKSAPLAVVWSNDGSRVVAACEDGRVRVVEADTVKVTHDLSVLKGWAYALAMHPTDGSAVVGGQDGQLRRVAVSTAR